MYDVIEALTIFLKYVDKDSYQDKYPFHCEHDILYINFPLSPESLSEEDVSRLYDLGIDWNSTDGFHSYRFGSC